MGEIARIQRAAHLIGHHIETALGDLRLTQAEAHVLVVLDRTGHAAIATLHHDLGLKRSTLTNVVDRLESRSLVRRQLNANDRRSIIVQPTAKGRRLARTVGEAFERLESALGAELSESTRAGFTKTLDALEALLPDSQHHG
jgi:DNA-binding MarR family transcriptional regulator